MMHGSLNEDNAERERNLLHQLDMMEHDYNHMLHQKSRLDWIHYGDASTKFFHCMIRGRKAKNSINVVINSDGNVLYCQEQVRAEFIDYFKNLIGTTIQSSSTVEQLKAITGKVIPSDLHDMLIEPFTDLDIFNALKSINPNKSPGPDGFTSHFYLEAWNTVGPDVLKAVKSFFSYPHMLREANASYIALVPKIKNPTMVKDYRPISCCNTMYKCISKLLANRLKICLPYIISANQSAFVPQRLMAENILVAHDIIKGYSYSKISPRCAMKVDIMKAFDTLSWDFIKNVLTAFGSPIFLLIGLWNVSVPLLFPLL